jgi:hypothetical protein
MNNYARLIDMLDEMKNKGSVNISFSDKAKFMEEYINTYGAESAAKEIIFVFESINNQLRHKFVNQIYDMSDEEINALSKEDKERCMRVMLNTAFEDLT